MQTSPSVSDASMAKESSDEPFNTVDRDRTDLLRLGKKQVLKALSLTVIGSSTAFNDLVSLWVARSNSSYLLASGLLFYHRCTGGILPHKSSNLSDVIIDKSEHLMWGPWRIPGMYGIINNVFACIYVVVIIFFSLWPPGQPVDAGSMNYCVLVTGAVAMFSVVYYFLWAKREYKGPVIEVN